MIVTIDHIDNIKTRLDNIRDFLCIPDKKIELEELEMKTADPEFYNGTIDTESIFKQIRELKKYIDEFSHAENLYNELECFYEMYKEDDSDEFTEDELCAYYNSALSAVETAEMSKILSNEGDHLGAVIEINAGAGGTEAEDWASMLVRMYLMWCKNNGYNVEVLSIETGSDSRLIKSCSIEINSPNAYGYLKSENGVHRLVRVSPYNAQGKRMTSFASVFVAPLVDDSITVEIDESKLEWQTFRSSGAGGQNVNKVETGVRAIYEYTDPDTGEVETIRVANTETRKQNDNKERARQILKSILYNKALQKRLAARKEIEDSKTKIEWGAQIRSYVFDDKRVKDHRTNYQTSDVEGVMNGKIDEFIKSYLLQF